MINDSYIRLLLSSICQKIFKSEREVREREGAGNGEREITESEREMTEGERE